MYIYIYIPIWTFAKMVGTPKSFNFNVSIERHGFRDPPMT